MNNFDVIIVGAGPGGCIVAKTIETFNKNINFVLIDSKSKENIGKKVCGDAIGKEIFDFLNKEINLEYPKEEITQKIKGIKVFSPDRQTIYNIETQEGGYMIDRKKFGQHLLRQLKNLNLINASVVDVFEEGVIVEKNNNGKIEKEKIYGKIVVDASGVSSVIRRNIKSIYIEKNLDPKDMMICYREIRNFNLNTDYSYIYLDNELTNGGYIWEFPENNAVNVGLGVGFPFKPKEAYDKYLNTNKIKEGKILNDDKGFGIVPTRRPIDSLVDYSNIGIMLVGDAACQVNPLHGGGIATAMNGGYLAGKTIVKIYEEKKLNNMTINDLWTYNLEYMKNEGARNASLDILKIFLQTLTNKEINFGMSKGIIDEKDILEINMGRLNLGIFTKLQKVAKGISNISLLTRLNFIVTKMNEIKTLYKNYPETSDKFFEWKQKVNEIYGEIYEKFRK